MKLSNAEVQKVACCLAEFSQTWHGEGELEEMSRRLRAACEILEIMAPKVLELSERHMRGQL